LRHLHTELSEAAARFCPEGQDPERWATRYSDGRPVISAMPMEAGLYVHTWHPDPAHPMNNRCELDVITTPDGTTKRIIVSAPGVIDAVLVAAGDGQQAVAQSG
jgi:hypothetical protein